MLILSMYHAFSLILLYITSIWWPFENHCKMKWLPSINKVFIIIIIEEILQQMAESDQFKVIGDDDSYKLSRIRVNDLITKTEYYTTIIDLTSRLFLSYVHSIVLLSSPSVANVRDALLQKAIQHIWSSLSTVTINE